MVWFRWHSEKVWVSSSVLWKALNGWRGNHVQSLLNDFQLLQKLSRAKGHDFPLKPTIYELGRGCIQIPTEHRLSDGIYAVRFTLKKSLFLKKPCFSATAAKKDQEIRLSDKASTLKEWKQELFRDRDWYFQFFSIYRTMGWFQVISIIYEWSNASAEYFRLLDPGQLKLINYYCQVWRHT